MVERRCPMERDPLRDGKVIYFLVFEIEV